MSSKNCLLRFILKPVLYSLFSAKGSSQLKSVY